MSADIAYRSVQGNGSSNRESDSRYHSPLVQVVLDFLGIDQIPAKYILKRWTKVARDVLPTHLSHIQKDSLSVNSITFRYSNLYTHALEVVRLGDATLNILKTSVDKLTSIAAVRDGMGLEDRIQANKGKDKEVLPACATNNGCGSDAEGSAIGNFVGLKAPERKGKTGRPTTSMDKPPYDDRGAKSKKYNRTTNAQAADGSGTSKHTCFYSICREPGHRAPHVHKEVIFLKKKEKRQNVQTVASVVTGKTLATSQRFCCMLLKMLL